VLTYAPGLNPNLNPSVEFVRDRFLPLVRQRMQGRHGQKTFSYGNFRNQNPDSLVQGWETYDARPRFGTNWMGLRGRLSVLSEGYSNADFHTRITATYNFVREVLQLAAEQAGVIRGLVAASDRRRPPSLAVRSTLGPPIERPVIAELTEDTGAGNGGYAPRRRTGVYRTIRMPVYDRFVAARTESVPAGYVVPARLSAIVNLLRLQGVAVQQLTRPWRGQVKTFRVDSVGADSLFEGHHPARVEGSWLSQPADTVLAAGTYLVDTDQPLGILAAYLLEPASEDGFGTWNFLDSELKAGAPHPVARVDTRPAAPAVAVP